MLQQTQTTFSTVQIRKYMEDGIENNDVQRVQGLIDIKKIKHQKLAAQKNEYKRLLYKHNKNNPRVIKQVKAIKASTRELKVIQIEITRASTEIPEILKNIWLAHGHVYNAIGNPLVNADVQVLSADGKEITRTQKVKTDANGYYKIVYQDDSETMEEFDDKGKDGNETVSDTTSGGIRINTNIEAMISVARASKIVMIRATDPSATTNYADSTFIAVIMGEVNYRDIIVNTKNKHDFSELDDIQKIVTETKSTVGGMQGRRKKS